MRGNLHTCSGVRRTPQPSALAGLLVIAASFACERVDIPPASASATSAKTTTAAARDAALRSARVWQRPAGPIAAADFSANPPGAGSFRHDTDVACRFSLEPVGGTTPKFNCGLPDGETVKVKYGMANPEIFTEVAATRLLTALGFATDSMYVVKAVRCAGCPKFPYPALLCIEKTGLKSCIAGGLNYQETVSIQPATIERRLAGDKIESFDDQGWEWSELDRIDPAAGGSSRAEVDAFRLMAVFLAHWDNKAENQRLLCPPGKRQADGGCAQPLAIIQDLGGTFGPTKLELHNWRQTPVWTNPEKCLVSMKNLPFNGATFPDRQISEGGRRMILGLLEPISEPQLVQLFTASGMTSYDQLAAAARDPRAWAAAFQDKVRQIRSAGPCP